MSTLLFSSKHGDFCVWTCHCECDGAVKVDNSFDSSVDTYFIAGHSRNDRLCFPAYNFEAQDPATPEPTLEPLHVEVDDQPAVTPGAVTDWSDDDLTPVNGGILDPFDPYDTFMGYTSTCTSNSPLIITWNRAIHALIAPLETDDPCASLADPASDRIELDTLDASDFDDEC